MQGWKGERCAGDPRSQELGRKLRSMERGLASELALGGRQKQRSGAWVMAVDTLRPGGLGRGSESE